MMHHEPTSRPPPRLQTLTAWSKALVPLLLFSKAIFMAIYVNFYSRFLADIAEAEGAAAPEIPAGFVAGMVAFVISAFILFLVAIVTLVVVIMLMYRFTSYLAFYGYSSTWKEGMVIASFLIPYANMVLPYLVLRDLWRAVHAPHPAQWQTVQAPPGILWGWLTYAVGSAVVGVVAVIGMFWGTLWGMQGGNVAGIPYVVFGLAVIPATAVAILWPRYLNAVIGRFNNTLTAAGMTPA